MRNVNFLTKIFNFSIFTLVAFLGTVNVTKAQSTIISGTGAGSFEGASFLADGWITVMGATPTNNNLALGNAATIGFTPTDGTKGVFVTNNGTTRGYAHTSSWAWIYKDVTLPAGETKATFTMDLFGNPGDLGFDGIVVGITDQTYTASLTTGATGTMTGSIVPGMTIATNATTNTFIEDGNYAVATTRSFNISPTSMGNSVASTTRRIWIGWRCDGSAGNLTTPLSFDKVSFTTALPTNYVSAATGNWSAAATWTPSGVPSTSDNVTIADGHTVTIDATATATCNNLTVGQGASGVLIFNSATARTIIIGGNLSIAAGGTFQSAASGTVTTHSLSIAGNITNSGTLDFSTNTNTAGAGITFTGSADQLISGTGTTTDLFSLTMSKSALANVVEFNVSNFSVRGLSSSAVGALLTSNSGTGTIKFSGSNTFSGTIWSATSYTIPSSLGFWLNNSNFTVQGQGASPTISGLLRVTSGTYNIGTSSGNSASGSSSTTQVTIEGGILNVAGRLNLTTSANYTQTGGILNINTVGNTASTGSFTSTGSTFTMSGGTIVLNLRNTNASPLDYNVSPTTTVITGGTLQVGSATTLVSSTFRIQGNTPNLVLNSTNNPSITQSAALSVFGDITLNGTGTYTNNSTALTIRGNSVANPGNLTINTGSVFTINSTNTQTLTFSSSFGNQTVTNSGTITSNQLPSLTVNNTFGGGTVSIPSGLSLMGGSTLTLTSGVLTVGGAGAITFIQAGAGTTTFAMTRTNGSISATSSAFGVASPTTLNYNYNTSAAGITTGLELPSTVGSTTPLTTLTINNASGVTIDKPVLVGTLTLTAGKLNTTTTNLVTVTGTTVASIARTSGYVSGPIARTLPASLTGTLIYNLPVGKATYNPLDIVNPTTNAGGSLVINAEAFDANAGGTAGTNMGSLNTDRYWAASITSGAGNFTSTFVRLTDASSASSSAIASSATLAGTYDIVGGSSPTVVVGTSVLSVTPASTSLPGFYVLGTKAVPMVYTSSTSTQTVTTAVIKPAVNQQIIGVQIVTTGNASPLSLTGMDFNTTGSTSPAADISNARVWYTGTSSTFATTTQFGSDVPTPSGTYTVTGSQALAEGINYFWLVYDVPSGATVDNLLDAECTSVNVGGAQTPTVTAPAGTRIIKAALANTYLIGDSQIAPNYTKLTAAIADLNAYGASAAVLFELQVDYSSSGETFPLQINAYPGNSAINTLTIKPKTGVTAAVSGSSASGIFVINGADYITIDGSNGVTANTVCSPSAATRDLTITNTNTSITNSVVWLQTATADGATNNKVINCNLIGSGNTQTLFGVGSGSSTITTSSLGTGNNNNQFVNNNISKTQYGIYSQGASAANKNTGTVISQNLINTVSPNNVQIGGIYVGFDNGATISGNTVSGMVSGTDAFGISTGVTSWVATTTTGNEVSNAIISKNVIGIVQNTGANSATGILVGPSATGTNQVSNNMVSGVIGNSTPGDLTAGIFAICGSGSTQVYYNTVSMKGNRGAGTTASSFALAVMGTIPTVDIRNNILINTQTTASTGKSYAIGLGYSSTTGNYTNLTSNNNDLFTSGANGAFACTGTLNSGTDRTTLALWTTETGRDGASKNVDPVFTLVIPTDLHLVLASNPMLNATGTPVSVTDDIDCDLRCPTGGCPGGSSIPDIGVDEFTPPPVNDLSLTALTAPANGSCFSGSENVIVQITNTGNQPWDFSTFSRTVSGTVTNGSPASFGPITITNAMNGGMPLVGGGTMTVTLGVLTNMQTPQVYTFNASLDASGDESGGAGSGNDALAPAVTRTSTNPTVTLTSNSPICASSTLQLTATSAGGNNNVTSMYNGTKTESPALAIPDGNATGATSDIILSGSGNITNTTAVSVTINISHTFDEDLDVYLVGPANCGAMELTTDNGSSGDNYTNTLLNTALTTPLITSGTSPFSGSFKPEGSVTAAPTTLSAFGGVNYVNLPLTSLVAGTCPINGTWKLYVGDDDSALTGTLSSWSLSITGTSNTGNYTDVFSGTGSFGTIAYSGANNSVADVSVTNPTATAYTATTTDASGCASAPSSSITPTINALPTTPVISSPLCHGATSVSGTSAEADGTTIEVFVDAVSAGTTTVTANVWTKTGLAALIGGNSITSSANNGVCTSVLSAPVVVGSLPTSPVIASPICPGTTTVSGTSTEANGTVIEVFVDAVTAGTTTVTANAWTKTVAALSTGNVITATATSGGCVSNLSLSVTVSPAPALPSINPSANQICPGTSVTFTAGNGSQYEFFKNAVSLGSPSRTNTYTTAVLANNDEISVRSYSPFTFDGNIVESPWGTALATSAGGPTPGFGAGHEINAVYVQGDANNINMALAGNVQDNNKILLFIDSKSGGYSDGNFGRDNSPDGLVNFNSGTTFDAGFEPDYCLVIGTNGAMNNYFFDLFTLSGTAGSGGGPNTYLGDKTTSFAGAVTGADPLNSSNTRGFEVAIPKLLLGYLSGTVKVMAMYTGNSGFLSNQFLSPAGSGDGNYGSGSVSFGSANPDAVIVPAGNLINNCYSSASVIMQVEGTVVKNSADAGFNTLRSVYNCIIDGGPTPITYDQPTTTTTLLTNPLTINKTLTIMGAGPGNKPEITVDFTGLGMSPGIMIGTGKTVTLTDVVIKDINNTNMPNNAVIEVQGTGTLKVTGSTIINKTP